MVNNYPEYAAGISYQKAEEGNKHFYNAQVKVDPSDDSMSAVLTKDGTVISELPDGGGGGSSDLNNPIELELIDHNNTLVTTLTAQEIYNLCLTGTPYFTVTAEQVETYGDNYKPDTKYFINEYHSETQDNETVYGFFFAMLGIADTTVDTVQTKLDLSIGAVDHLIIAGGL